MFSLIPKMCELDRSDLITQVVETQKPLPFKDLTNSHWNVLITLAKDNCAEGVGRILSEDSKLCTPSYVAAAWVVACGKGHMDVINKILQWSRVEELRKEKYYWVGFAVACAENQVAVAELVIESFLDHPAMNSVLQRSAQCGLSEIVKLIQTRCPTLTLERFSDTSSSDPKMQEFQKAMSDFMSYARQFKRWDFGGKHFTENEKASINSLMSAYENVVEEKINGASILGQGQLGQCIYLFKRLAEEPGQSWGSRWDVMLECTTDRHYPILFAMLSVCRPNSLQFLKDYMGVGEPSWFTLLHEMKPTDATSLQIASALGNISGLLTWAERYHSGRFPMSERNEALATKACQPGLDAKWDRATTIMARWDPNLREAAVNSGDPQALWDDIQRNKIAAGMEKTDEARYEAGLKSFHRMEEHFKRALQDKNVPLVMAIASACPSLVQQAIDNFPDCGEGYFIKNWTDYYTLQYFEKAVSLNFGLAAFYLGLRCADPKDQVNAWKTGAKLGNRRCMEQLATQLRKEGDDNEAARWEKTAQKTLRVVHPLELGMTNYTTTARDSHSEDESSELFSDDELHW